MPWGLHPLDFKNLMYLLASVSKNGAEKCYIIEAEIVYCGIYEVDEIWLIVYE